MAESIEMTAVPKNIEDVLSINKEYVIPRFQREYSWEDSELSVLLEDIVSKITVMSKDNFETEEYFIGSLVLVGNSTSSKQFLVVDGQQRLTTITILFSVLTQIFEEQKEKVLADQVHKYIQYKNNDGEPIFRIKNETPKPFFQTRIQSQIKERDQRDPETEEEVRLLSAYNYYYDALSDYKLRKVFKKDKSSEEIVSVGAADYVSLLKALRNQLLALTVIQIAVPDKDTANIIFETLNAKGKDLEPIDLIKNKIFQTLSDENPIDKTKEDWKALRKIIYSRSQLVKIGDFYRHFWISNYSITPASKLYEKFLKQVPQTKSAYTEFIDRLKNSASSYVQIAAPLNEDWPRIEDKEVYQALDLMRILANKQSRSLILALMENRKIIKDNYFHKAFNILENMHFLLKFSKSNPSWIESTMSTCAKKIRKSTNAEETGRIIDQLEKDISSRMPPYDQFRSGFEKLTFLDGVTKDKKLIQYIFKKFEHRYQETKELTTYEMSLDHISPQVLDLDNGGEIGNLLPLGQGLNSKMGHMSFESKKQKLKESEYMTVKEFLKENSGKTEWTAKDISDRTERLARLAYYEIWHL